VASCPVPRLTLVRAGQLSVLAARQGREVVENCARAPSLGQCEQHTDSARSALSAGTVAVSSRNKEWKVPTYSEARCFEVDIADYSPVTSVTVDTDPVCEHNVSKDPNLIYDPARSLPITQAPAGSYSEWSAGRSHGKNRYPGREAKSFEK